MFGAAVLLTLPLTSGLHLAAQAPTAPGVLRNPDQSLGVKVDPGMIVNAFRYTTIFKLPSSKNPSLGLDKHDNSSNDDL